MNFKGGIMIKSWQTIEENDRGKAVISFLELDMSQGIQNSKLNLKYKSFKNHSPLKLMYEFGEFLSAFGPQAPKHRSILLFRKETKLSVFTEKYPNYDPISYKDSLIVSANIAECVVLYELYKENKLFIENKQVHLSEDLDEFLYDKELVKDIINRLIKDERLLFYPSGKTDFRTKNEIPNKIELLVPINTNAGYLLDQAILNNSIAAFNGGFFNVSEEEFDDPFTFALDPVGLVIENNEIISPPIYRRSSFIITNRIYYRNADESEYSLGLDRPIIRVVGLHNYAIKFQNGLVFRGEGFEESSIEKYLGSCSKIYKTYLNPSSNMPKVAAFYNRVDQDGKTTKKYTPKIRENIEITIVGNSVCAVKEGGETYIPRNGFIISIPCTFIPDWKNLFFKTTSIKQAIYVGEDVFNYQSGVHVGVQILNNGKPTNISEQFFKEEYIPMNKESKESGIAPLFLREERLYNKNLALIGIGTTFDNKIYLVQIEGCEPRTFDKKFDSTGGSIEDLLKWFLKLGCENAVYLDGGGSAQIIFKNKSIIKASDRHDVFSIPSLRLNPGGWMIYNN
jgi:Phosphodiester glycosidase